MADNHAPGLSVATSLFFVWSVLIFGVRVWVKSRRSESWDWDDTTITAALVRHFGPQSHVDLSDWMRSWWPFYT